MASDKGYKAFNSPKGPIMKRAGQSVFLNENKKSQSFANESGTPGQSTTGMSAVNSKRMYTGPSVATDTYTQRKTK